VRILGISGGFHDAAAALVEDGTVVAAVEQERLSRRKHDADFPAEAMDACLAIAGCEAADVDVVALHEQPVGVVDRHLRSRLRAGPRAAGALLVDTPSVLAAQLGTAPRVARWFAERDAPLPTVHVSEHHLSHAAAAFYPSPFEHAAVLTVDGVGEWATTAVGAGHGHRLAVHEELRHPHSLGLLYSAFTAFCGFRANGGEGELMGLAPFGTPRYAGRIRDHLVDLADDGSLRLDERLLSLGSGRRMTTRRFARLFDGPPLPRGAEPTQREADLAASVQEVLVEALVALARRAVERAGTDALCLGGGVALNCVANAAIAALPEVGSLWVAPAPGDGGSALGAALWSWHEVQGHPRAVDPGGSCGDWALGPAFDHDAVHRWLTAGGVAHEALADPGARAERAADLLAAGAVVGWFDGPMEFGPRALGHRSILADPRGPETKDRLNRLVKERAGFRPFAPAVLAERAAEWFDLSDPSPHMTRTATVAATQLRPVAVEPDGLSARAAAARSTIPAVTHVDGSARVQTVHEAASPSLHRVLRAFEARTGCPVVLNTSFNGHDEPIVCTPDHALATARRIGLDAVVLEGCVVEALR
jgi:carbamoyltransferase